MQNMHIYFQKSKCQMRWPHISGEDKLSIVILVEKWNGKKGTHLTDFGHEYRIFGEYNFRK